MTVAAVRAKSSCESYSLHLRCPSLYFNECLCIAHLSGMNRWRTYCISVVFPFACYTMFDVKYSWKEEGKIWVESCDACGCSNDRSDKFRKKIISFSINTLLQRSLYVFDFSLDITSSQKYSLMLICSYTSVELWTSLLYNVRLESIAYVFAALHLLRSALCRYELGSAFLLYVFKYFF